MNRETSDKLNKIIGNLVVEYAVDIEAGREWEGLEDLVFDATHAESLEATPEEIHGRLLEWDYEDLDLKQLKALWKKRTANAEETEYDEDWDQAEKIAAIVGRRFMDKIED